MPRSAEETWQRAEDGTAVHLLHLPPLEGPGADDPLSDTAVVLVHGFLGSGQKPKIRALGQWLSSRLGVVLPDLRGHGASGGESTGGALEHMDVAAAVHWARGRGYEKVVTVGGSMGAVAVIRHAAIVGGVEGCVAISAPAAWDLDPTLPIRIMRFLSLRAPGRLLARKFLGTRIARPGHSFTPPEEAARYVRAPLLIIHGTDDRFFGPDQAERVFARAPGPKKLVVLDGFGHAEDGYTPAFARRLEKEIRSMLADPEGWSARARPGGWSVLADAKRSSVLAEPEGSASPGKSIPRETVMAASDPRTWAPQPTLREDA